PRPSLARGRQLGGLGRVPAPGPAHPAAARGAGGRARASPRDLAALRQLRAVRGAKMTASVILPTYNERPVIVGVVRDIRDAVSDAEVLVVDDDSPDRTWELIGEAFAGDPRARTLRRVGRRGLPSALAEGVAGTKGDVVVWLDADGSMPADVIPRLVAATGSADVVVASRYAAGGADGRDSRARILASQAINLVATACLGG